MNKQTKKPCKIIWAALDHNGGIGFKGKIPWSIPADLRRFAELTSKTQLPVLQNAVIMGRNTWESIENRYRPLKNRLNIIVSKSDTLIFPPSVHQFPSLLRAVGWASAQESIESIWIIGGAEIYNEALKSGLANEVYATWIESDKIECDTMIDSSMLNSMHESKVWKLVEESERQCSDNNNVPLTFRFSHYVLSNSLGLGLENLEPRSPNFEELQYLDIIRDVLKTGNYTNDRTGTGTLSKFGYRMKFDLRNNTFPLLTTKKVFFRGVVEELLWFINGCTDANVLHDKGIKIWDDNASRKYLDSLGFTTRLQGDLGPIYGFQWRHFGAVYQDCHTDYNGKGIDQLQQVIHLLKNNKESRRIILCAWNPSDIPLMALPPCHALCQFHVSNNTLSCQLYQRSADLMLGVPFNIASYALLTIILAKHCGLEPGDFVHILGDTHIYLNHVDGARLITSRIPRPFPTILLQSNPQHIEDFAFDDFILQNYHPHPAVQLQMSV